MREQSAIRLVVIIVAAIVLTKVFPRYSSLDFAMGLLVLWHMVILFVAKYRWRSR